MLRRKPISCRPPSLINRSGNNTQPVSCQLVSSAACFISCSMFLPQAADSKVVKCLRIVSFSQPENFTLVQCYSSHQFDFQQLQAALMNSLYPAWLAAHWEQREASESLHITMSKLKLCQTTRSTSVCHQRAESSLVYLLYLLFPHLKNSFKLSLNYVWAV